MKKLNIFLSMVLGLAILSTGCKKDTVTVPKTETQLLTAHTWEVEEYAEDISGTIKTYTRGGSSNTINHDQTRFTFNTNGTGTSISNIGTAFTMTWSFTDPTDIHIVLSSGGSSTSYDESLVSLSDSTFNETTVLSNGLASTRLIPVP